MVTAVIVVVGALVVGSVAEIHAQSAPERQMTDQGWGELASRVILDSNQTGAQLSSLMAQAPTIPNDPWSASGWAPAPGSNSARARIQQGLDTSVASADQQATAASQLAPPGPSGDLTARLAAVLTSRATTVTALRATIDRLLGMTPLPVAGAPVTSTDSSSTTPADGVALISVTQAAAETSAEGAAFATTDREYARLAAELRQGTGTGGGPIRLPRSVWAPPGRPLSSASLGALPAQLAPPDGSAALVPFHQVILSAVGLVPAAVPSTTPGDQAGSGIVGVSCAAASAAPVAVGTAPTGATATAVLPPTPNVSAEVTVTNCGTVTETDVPVIEKLALADAPGTAPPAAGDQGGTSTTHVTLLAGGSQALSLGSLAVAAGDTYTLTVSLVLSAPPAGPANLADTVQTFGLSVPG